MKAAFKYKITQKKKRKRILDWKKRVIYLLLTLLAINFAWDSYDRIPIVKKYSNQCYENVVKYSRIYYGKGLNKLNKNHED